MPSKRMNAPRLDIAAVKIELLAESDRCIKALLHSMNWTFKNDVQYIV